MRNGSPSKIHSEADKSFIDSLVQKIKKQNSLMHIVGTLMGFIFPLMGIIALTRGIRELDFFIAGIIFILLGLPFLIGTILSFFRPTTVPVAIDYSVLKMKGKLTHKTLHSTLPSRDYIFYINNNRLHVFSPAWVNVLFALDGKTITLDVVKVPNAYNSSMNPKNVEYIVTGIFNYSEFKNRSSAIYTVAIQKLSVVPAIFTIAAIITFVLYTQSALDPLSGFIFFLPGILVALGLLFSCVWLIQGGIRYNRASSAIYEELTRGVNSHIDSNGTISMFSNKKRGRRGRRYEI